MISPRMARRSLGGGHVHSPEHHHASEYLPAYPALDRAVAVRGIELIRGGTVLYAYRPSARESTLAAR
jgi:hypothetical protein